MLALLEAAWRALPVVEELPIDELWVGFRPTSRDDAPILGPTSVEGLVLATGQHRNGILLTPDHGADGERSRPDRAGPGLHPRIHDRPLWRRTPVGAGRAAQEGAMNEAIILNGHPVPIEHTTLDQLVAARIPDTPGRGRTQRHGRTARCVV